MVNQDEIGPQSDSLSAAVGGAVSVGVFTALIIAGSYVSVPIPMTPVPVALQSLFVFIAALILGPRNGVLAVALFLALGAVGLPVFAGGRGGPAHLIGPTGGYLLGYLPAAMVCGLIARWGTRLRTRRSRAVIDAVAAVVGTAVLYACGVTVLALVTGMELPAAIAAGALPFLPGDAIKVVVAVAAAPAARARMHPRGHAARHREPQ